MAYCDKRYELAGETYRTAIDAGGIDAIDFVRYGHCFIALGDNTSSSKDSRRWTANVITDAHLARDPSGTHHASERIDQQGTGVRSGKAGRSHARRCRSHQPRW